MKSRTLVFIFVLGLSACAVFPTQRGFEQILQSWQGADINVLIARWGPPSRTDELPNGNKMYTFNRSQTYTTPVYVTPSYVTPSTTTVNVYGNTAYATTTPGQVYGGQVYGGDRVTNQCSVSFTSNATQRIIAWRYEGNACRAPEQSHDIAKATILPAETYSAVGNNTYSAGVADSGLQVGSKATIWADAVALYADPSFQSRKTLDLSRGNQVEILQFDGGWARVRLDSNVGWVVRSWLESVNTKP